MAGNERAAHNVTLAHVGFGFVSLVVLVGFLAPWRIRTRYLQNVTGAGHHPPERADADLS